jgi:flagellar M-ring protein FliF
MSAVAQVPVAENPPPAVTQAPASWQQRISDMDRGQRLRWGAVAAVAVAAVAAAFFFSRQPDYRVLFSNLSDKDGGAIVAQLTG